MLRSPSAHRRNICTETNEVMKHLAELKEAFLKRDYQEATKDDQFN